MTDYPNLQRLANGGSDHSAEAAAALEEIEKLRAIIKTHDLCHDLHGKVDARAFADGCASEQRKLYGCAPDADAVERLEKECFELSASHCHGGYGDASGRHRCNYQDEIERLQAELASREAEVAELRVRTCNEFAELFRVLEWYRSSPRKPATHAFTAGPERQIAYLIEEAAIAGTSRYFGPAESTSRLG